MKVLLMAFLLWFSSSLLIAQKFYLGNYLEPTSNEFELLGISSKTGVHTYKYKKVIYDTFFDKLICVLLNYINYVFTKNVFFQIYLT
jgi:hypothetical protein